MKPLSLEMQHDHGRCDALFAHAEAAADAGQWTDCATRTEAFVQAMANHFALEETVLFPAFEARTGMAGGPTQVMRQEHDQLRGLLGRFKTAAEMADAAQFADLAETLLILMQQHNLKEEHILYPMCDDVIGDDPGVREAVAGLGAQVIV